MGYQKERIFKMECSNYSCKSKTDKQSQ